MDVKSRYEERVFVLLETGVRCFFRILAHIIWTLLSVNKKQTQAKVRAAIWSDWKELDERVESLEKFSPMINARLRRRLRGVVARHALRQVIAPAFRFFFYVTCIFSWIFLGIGLAQGIEVLKSAGVSAVWLTRLVLAVPNLLIAATLFSMAWYFDNRLSRLQISIRVLRRMHRISVVGICVFQLGLLAVCSPGTSYARGLNPIANNFLLLAVFLLPVSGLQYIRYLHAWKNHPPEDRLDLAMLRLLDVASAALWCSERKWRWSNAAYSREIIAEIEHAARDAERFSLVRVPRMDYQARHYEERIGLRVASTIRSHKHVLATARDGTDYTEVAASIIRGLNAWLVGDLCSFLDSSDAGEAHKRRYLEIFARRALPAALLVSAAFLLPLIPIFHEFPDGILYIRVSLLISAFLAIVTGEISTSGRITTILDRYQTNSGSTGRG